jgi:hypothetical protein
LPWTAPDELPRPLTSRAERLARLQQAKAQLKAEAAARQFSAFCDAVIQQFK